MGGAPTPKCTIGFDHSLQGAFSSKMANTLVNRWFLKRTLDEENGESNLREVSSVCLPFEAKDINLAGGLKGHIPIGWCLKRDTKRKSFTISGDTTCCA